MRYYKNLSVLALFTGLFVLGLLATGCAQKQTINHDPGPPPLISLSQIDSFSPAQACRQAIDVINNNPYGQEFFEKVFARVVEQCKNNRSRANADIIWNNLVMPLEKSAKVPPDLLKTTWNYYFSRQFVSLPAAGPITHYCNRLSGIKKNLEKEYQLKIIGFEICDQGSADPHFLNAMYVYNTMWAACNGCNTEKGF